MGGQNDKAIKEIEKLSKLYPQNTDYLSILAQTAMTSSDYDKAFAYYKKIEEVSPDDENNSASFTITLSDGAENKITASATDNVGNVTEAKNFAKFGNGAQIVQDDQTPEIGVDLDGFYFDTVGDVTTYYEKQDENIRLSLSQKKSGLNSVSVRINGVELTEDVNGKSFVQANYDYMGKIL